MNTELLFATNNNHKLMEAKSIIGNHFRVISLNEAGINIDIPEKENTIKGNALSKARFIYELTGKNCFADDTGLEVKALDRAPGVYSARYAGEMADAEANIEKLLTNLKGQSNREARFKTVIALIISGEEHIFEGTVEGFISETKRGNGGFGYDPVFIPEGYQQSFAEMKSSEKNSISHRARALQKMKEFLIAKTRSNF